MPLKLNTGISRKIGQPNFGSIQGSCFLEIELASDILHDTDKFQAQIRQAFRSCEQAVDEQLAGKVARAPSDNAQSNGHVAEHDQNGKYGSSRLATQSQIRAIKAIANKQRINVASFLLSRHGCQSMDALTIKQASEAIDQLKSRESGVGR